ncbi:MULTISPECIES: hypothetical protein [unclassified Mesorhizobium]|uniref:hypothetical protein n=1 Tax=unclassified Mesorhizobium TaxID=325217 RepID=UPI0024153357|nr:MULTISPECIES: hypothetical protein [unclassified Mesorhizobium]
MHEEIAAKRRQRAGMEPARPSRADSWSSDSETYFVRMSDGWTFQELIEAGMSVTGGCLDCRRHHKLDLPALRDRFGADAPAMEWDLRPRMKCGVCGGKRITLTYSPDTSPKELHRKIVLS